MRFGIIAGGEGSRLRQEGSSVVKPLVEINGIPVIGRLLKIFSDCGARSVDVLLNSDMSEVSDYLTKISEDLNLNLNLWLASTPSSFHSFSLLVDRMKPEGKFVITTVDTVFPGDRFKEYIEFFNDLSSDIKGLMGVTSYIDDEKPLYVSIRRDNFVAGFLDWNDSGCKFVSAGVYGLTPSVVPLIKECRARDVCRMRNFQRELISHDFSIKAFDLGTVVDIDHIEDIQKAERLFGRNADLSLINNN